MEQQQHNLGGDGPSKDLTASLLKIGNWEHRPRKKGYLLAKFFHAKQKLVWEVLLNEKYSAIKKRIEIHWSNIRALQANYSDGVGRPDTLLVVLDRPPLFLMKHDLLPDGTQPLWQNITDFTDTSVSLYRRHYLERKRGLLQELIKHNPRLNFLSQQAKIASESSELFDLDDVTPLPGSVEAISTHGALKKLSDPGFSHTSDDVSGCQKGRSIYSALHIGHL